MQRNIVKHEKQELEQCLWADNSGLAHNPPHHLSVPGGLWGIRFRSQPCRNASLGHVRTKTCKDQRDLHTFASCSRWTAIMLDDVTKTWTSTSQTFSISLWAHAWWELQMRNQLGFWTLWWPSFFCKVAALSAVVWISDSVVVDEHRLYSFHDFNVVSVPSQFDSWYPGGNFWLLVDWTFILASQLKELTQMDRQNRHVAILDKKGRPDAHWLFLCKSLNPA